MADEFLTEGAQTLAGAAWSGSGFASAAELNITRGSQHITTALDQSGSSIEYLRITDGFTGQIGSASGSMIVDADNSTDAYVRIEGGTAIWLEAGSGQEIENLYGKTPGKVTLTGGTTVSTEWSAGQLVVGASATTTTLYLFGGSGVIEDGAAITNVYISGGSWTIRRPPGTITMMAGNLTYDNPDGDAATALQMYGGHVTWYSGNIPTCNVRAGTFDASRAARPLTLAGTAGEVWAGATVKYDRALVTASGFTYRGNPDVATMIPV